MKKVVVIGAGISGLSCAYRLTRLAREQGVDLEVAVVEGSGRAGGVICTRRFEDAQFLIEEGPDNFITTKPAALALCKELGLEDQIIKTDERFRRAFIAAGGKLVPVPRGFTLMVPTHLWSFLDSPLFTLSGKLRACLELFQPARLKGDDENLESFIVRRFGRELYERLAQPLIGGIYTGDPANLSARAVAPQFVALEEQYGSVIKGALKQRQTDLFSIASGRDDTELSKDGGARYSIFVTLANGLADLVDRLVSQIGSDKIQFNCQVERIKKSKKGWSVDLNNGESIDCDAVVAGLSASVLAGLVSDFDEPLAKLLSEFKTASSVVLNALFERRHIEHALDGFGAVVPESEKRSVMALSFSSVKFAGRAPQGKAIVRAFLGGAMKPELNDLADADLIKLAVDDMKYYLGVSSFPLAVWLKRWPDSMPQYEPGHRQRVEELASRLASHEGLAFAGNALDGVGIPDCIESANKTARQVFERLGGRSLETGQRALRIV